jgi:hypothetical protein
VRHLDRPLNDGGTLLVTGALAGGVAGATSAALVLLRWNGGLRDFPMEPVGIGGGGLMGAVCGGGLGFVGAVLVLRLASDRASSVDAG